MKPKEKRKVNAVIYARYSSAGQRDESIEGQIRECQAYAEKYGYTIVGEYIDRALTATTDKRPNFQKMIKDSEAREFNMVLCWKHDRFARNRYDAAVYKKILLSHGVKVEYAMEHIPDGADGIVFEAMLEGYAEYYSVNLSENVRRGQYESMLKHKTLGVRVFGLMQSNEDTFIPNPNEAPIVQRIFNEYLDGKPSKAIAEQLNSEGFRYYRGSPFTLGNVHKILTNEKYAGTYSFGEYSEEDVIEPIVSKATFNAVKEKLKLRSITPNESTGENAYYLTHKAFCSCCGTGLVSESAKNKSGKLYRYYRCPEKECGQNRISKTFLEDLVFETISEFIFSDTVCEEIAKEVVKHQDDDKTAEKLALEAAEADYGDVKRKLDNLYSALEDGLNTPHITSRIKELEYQVDEIRNRILDCQAQLVRIDVDDVMFFLDRFRNASAGSEEWKRLVLGQFLEAVYFSNDKVTIVLDQCGTPKEFEFDFEAIKKAQENGKCSFWCALVGQNKSKTNTCKIYIIGRFIVLEKSIKI